MTRAPADDINPAHYQGIAECPHCGKPIEAITITERFGFVLGNALKYILRAGKKGDRLTDLQKARWYVNREVQVEHARLAAAGAATAPPAASPAPDTRQPAPGVYEAQNERTQG